MKKNSVYVYLGKYLLIPFDKYISGIRHLMFDFILDLKNIQAINKWKVQYNFTVRKK